MMDAIATEPMEQLLALYARYKDWVATQTVDQSDVTHHYRIPPTCTMDFASYTALPFRLFDDDEVQAMFRFLVDGPQNDGERAIHSYVSHVLTARFENLANRALQDDMEILSIGSDCLPRIIFSKWGIQRTRMFGKLSYPFDLALVQPKAALRLVAQDFNGLVDRSSLSYLAGYDYPINTRDGFIFNHESGGEWIANDFARLISLYTRRVRDFRASVGNEKHKIFLFNYCDRFTGDAAQFFRAGGLTPQQDYDADARDLLVAATQSLAARTSGKIAVLCVVSGYVGPDAPVVQLEEFAVDGALVRVVRVPRPTSTYTFYDPADYAAASGLEFERAIVAALGDIAAAVFPQMEPISSGVDIARCG